MSKLDVYRCEKCGAMYAAPPKSHRVCAVIRMSFDGDYGPPPQWTPCGGRVVPFTLGASLVFGHEDTSE